MNTVNRARVTNTTNNEHSERHTSHLAHKLGHRQARNALKCKPQRVEEGNEDPKLSD